jgi:hypothetical protein
LSIAHVVNLFVSCISWGWVQSLGWMSSIGPSPMSHCGHYQSRSYQIFLQSSNIRVNYYFWGKGHGINTGAIGNGLRNTSQLGNTVGRSLQMCREQIENMVGTMDVA